jgi:hypothetical protein
VCVCGVFGVCECVCVYVSAVCVYEFVRYCVCVVCVWFVMCVCLCVCVCAMVGTTAYCQILLKARNSLQEILSMSAVLNIANAKPDSM